MSSSSSEYSESDGSEISFSDFELEGETCVTDGDGESTSMSEDLDRLHLTVDDPVADEAWTAQYKKELEEGEQRNARQQERLDGIVELTEWCKCGNCQVSHLQNINECLCCTELEECMNALTKKLVREDVPPNTKLMCVTQHPGFQPVCLEKWSLRSAASKYKTKDKKRYRQTGSEVNFLRSVAYREFTRMIYGVAGDKRFPLPACAYTAIRIKFPIGSEDTYVGFDLDED